MSGPRPLSDSIPRITGKVFARKYIMLGRLVTRWADIVGVDLADKAQPVKIRHAKNKEGALRASLDIAVTSADAMLLHYRKDLILERINQIFGERLVAAIRFVPIAANEAPAPLRKKPAVLKETDKVVLDEILGSIQDAEIRSSLESLGRSFYAQPEPA